MGSFIITLKTINGAGIYTRSWDPDPEQGSNPLGSQHQDPWGAPPASPLEHSHPCGRCLRQRAPPGAGSI